MPTRRTSLVPFVLISLAFHLLFFFPWEETKREAAVKKIPVTIQEIQAAGYAPTKTVMIETPKESDATQPPKPEPRFQEVSIHPGLLDLHRKTSVNWSRYRTT